MQPIQEHDIFIRIWSACSCPDGILFLFHENKTNLARPKGTGVREAILKASIL